MDEDNSKRANRRTVVKTVAGVGVAGLGAQPALASSGDDVEKDEEYPMGPLADASDSEKLTYREFQRLLSTEENGSAELVSGRATEVRTYVGDDRSVGALDAKERFEAGAMANKPTWELGCVNVPLIGDVCSEITLDISTSGIVFDLVIFGYPIVGAGIKFNDGDVSFKFNVPKIPVKGELTVGASSIGACDVSVTAELSLNVVPYTLGGSKTFTYC